VAGLAPGQGADIGAQFATLCQQTSAALGSIDQTVAEGAPPELIGVAEEHLKSATHAWLGSLNAQQLQALAVGAGFEHPSLVGLNAKPGHPSALAHWLDPAYPSTSMSKAAIQAKAAERYDKLLAGEPMAGMSLADMVGAEQALAKHKPGGTSWVATPEQLHQLQAHLDDIAAKASEAQSAAERAALLAEAISTENLFSDASCPAMSPDELDARKAAARKTTTGLSHGSMWELVNEPTGPLEVSGARLVNSSEALALLRHSTPAEVLGPIQAKAAQRQADFEQLKASGHALAPHLPPPAGPASSPLKLHALSGTEAGHDEVLAFTKAAGQWAQAHTAIEKWWVSAIGRASLNKELGLGPGWGLPGPGPGGLTTSFRSWAKQQPLGELKEVAAALGTPPDGLKGATRAQVQNWVAARWDPGVSAPDFSAPNPKPAKALKPAPVTPAPASGPGAVAGTGTGTGAVILLSKFAARKNALREKLAHHVASVSALPARQPQADIDAMALSPTAAPPVGGAHKKVFFTGPEASTWMFKPDKAQGARAHAEAAASELLGRAGLPAVPVYTAVIGGQKGSLQPFISGTGPLDPAVQAWSQADVDAIVRYHVGAWAVGDHDGKPDNVLRTVGGGLVPIDQGQAFKFFGSDHLGTTYHPNGAYGAGQPVYHQAYAAAKGGALAKGVRIRPEAALPVISTFEAIPDAQYRSILHDTAHEGARHKVSWYPAMRARAAKAHSVLSPTDAQVAEAFLDHACERKNRLRADFAGFFAAEGLSNEALAAQMG